MNYDIYRLKTFATTVRNYSDEKKGALDDRSRADLKATAERLDELGADRDSAQERLITAQDRQGATCELVRQAIIRGRRAIQMTAVGVPGGVSLPRATAGMYTPSRIYSTALSHVQALGNAGADPAITKATTQLKGAMEEFNKAYSAARAQRFAWNDFNGAMAGELATISSKLDAYKKFASCNVPRPERRELPNRLRVVAPNRSRHRGVNAKTQAETQPATATAQPPALPAVPATPVPPSTEHPTMSANA